MTRVEVASETDLGPGDRAVVDTEQAGEVGVFNVDGEYYAVRNRCPHRGGPVCEGKVADELVGEWTGVGDRPVRTYGEDPAITCPWHGWDFSLRDGTHVGVDSISVPTYDVVVEDGSVYVEL